MGQCKLPTTQAGYVDLERWANSLGEIDAFGVEGTGSYGAGLARFLKGEGHSVIEVNRSNRSTRRRIGKSDTTDTEMAAKYALLSLSRRYAQLAEEIEGLNEELERLTMAFAPMLMGSLGVGTDTASALLVMAGSNPERLRSDAAFAALCGVNPIPASSGKTNRYRLNRGGDCRANAALYRIVIIRLRYDVRTKTYL